MWTITTKLISSYAPLIIRAETGTDTETTPERVVRTPTIDGGVVLYSLGKTDGDRTLTINAKLTRAERKQLENMRNDYTDFVFAGPDGCFAGMIVSVSGQGGNVTITFLPDGN
jgi:hypothetical protein